MEPPVLPRRVYRFGLFQVEADGGKLLRQGVPVKLQEQPLRVLRLLLEKPGEVVTREELRQSLWPEGTYVEFDGSLNAALKRLRFALGDDADNPIFIETVPRCGYRFIAPVSVIASGRAPDQPSTAVATAAPSNGAASVADNGQLSAASSSISQNIASKRPRRSRVLRYSAMTVVVAVLAWQAIYWTFPIPGPRVVRRIRLTNTGGLEPGPTAVGTDRVFFTVRRGGRFFPMQVPLQGGEPSEIETPFTLAYVFDISPDQANLLLGSAETRVAGENALWIWPLRGGAPHRFGDYTCRAASWSPDGRQIAFTSKGYLYLAFPDGTGLQKLAHFDATPFDMAWSPDGERISLTVYDDLARLHALWEVNRDGSGLHKINPWNEKNPNLRDGAWLKNGEYFAFWRGTEADMSLWLIRERASAWRRSESAPVQLASSRNDSVERVFGHCAYDSRLCAITNNWRDSKFMQILPQNQRFASASWFSTAYSIDFSPTGNWVAFASGKDGWVWRCRVDGRDCIPLMHGKLHADLVRWSPDGRQILFNGQADEGPARLHAVPADGSSPPRILSPMDKTAGRADWSPDGTQIVVSLGPVTPTDGDAIYLLDAATGKPQFVPGSEGLHDPVWSPNGKWIAAGDSLNRKILFYDVAGKRWIKGPEGKVVSYFHWSRHSEDLFYQELGTANQTVFRVKPGTTTARFYRDFAEILSSQAAGCRVAGIGPDDSLYFYTLENKSDLVLLDLDLP
jgi:DNA-binding winged helix-turn-helix (wHTH) protein/Tol biopolymer transport system component